MIYTLTLVADVRPEEIIQELSIEPSAWEALDEGTRWAVLQTREAVATAFAIAWRRQNRPGDGYGGFAGRVVPLADDYDCETEEPPSLAALRRTTDFGGVRDYCGPEYWMHRAELGRRARRFLAGQPLDGSRTEVASRG